MVGTTNRSMAAGREFAAWLGLVPRQNSTGGKTRLGGITKRGNRYLRRLLINGASANLLRSKATKADPWVIGIRRRRPPLVVAVALANKTARIACRETRTVPIVFVVVTDPVGDGFVAGLPRPG